MKYFEAIKDTPISYNCRRRLPGEVYEDNYQYLMNYYQPMIDYLEEKEDDKETENTKQNKRPVYLPWHCERSAPRYNTRKPISQYSPTRIPYLARNAKNTAKHYLDTYRFDIKRSLFSVTETAIASRVEEHLKDVTYLDKFEKKIQQRINKVGKTIAEDREERKRKLAERMRDPLENVEFDFPDRVKIAIKGKNEKQIAQILWYDSLRRQMS